MSSLRKFIIFLPFILFFYISSTHAQSNANFFEGSEHITLGDKVKLRFSKDDPGQTKAVLHLPNGLSVTYGDIVSFGDFYEIVGQSIARAETDRERKMRFMAAFHSFATDPTAVFEAHQLLDVLHNEEKVIADVIHRGEDPEAAFEKMASETNRQLNCITGGGCSSKTWFLKPGRYLKLANMDFDHFGNDAIITYQIGHEAALDEAINARLENDPKRLEIAYAMNAFACHFLSDRFATGHMRTPRYDLYFKVSPSVTGSILAGYMHREENGFGLHVHNARGDQWIAYGDRAYFTDKNERNRNILHEALQISADDIFYAYIHGMMPNAKNVLDLIPETDEVNDQGTVDVAPLFFSDTNKNKLMRRVKTSDLYDRHWTSSWWGWSTLVQLSHERGIPAEAQTLLARSELRDAAIRDGLITNVDILQAIKRHEI